MDLNQKKEGTYKYDAASLGEVMLRLDPGEGRIRTARSFRARWYIIERADILEHAGIIWEKNLCRHT